MALWLQEAAATEVEAAVTDNSTTINVPLYLANSFSGEIVLLSKSETPVYQKHQELTSGISMLEVPMAQISSGTYLLLLHDFDRRELQTVKVDLP
jgi:hypothetical protein